MATKTESIENLLEARIHQALRYWHDPARTDGVLTDLLAFAEPAPGAPLDPRTRTNDFLRTALQRLATEQPIDAELLTARFIERIPADQVALKLKFAESTIFMKQNQAIKRLAKVVAELEADAWRDRRRRVDERIPVPAASDPVGHEAHLNHLLDLLHGADAPWIISLEGIGGIGKTTLAAALTRTVAATRTFADFGWVSAKAGILDLGGAIRAVPQPALTVRALVADLLRQLAPEAADSLLATPEQALSFLRSRLKRTPHLIVVDNLETVRDVDVLLSHLRDLADPSKFILTSRHNLYHEHDIHHFSVPALDRSQALALVRFEASVRNLPATAAASDEDLAPIFDLVGGNPLALRLVVGQLHIHALPAILHDLASVNSRKVESLYTFIYRRAWDNLDEPARRLLLAMPLTDSHGGDLDFLAIVSALGDGDLRHALDTLVMLNLVDARGELHHRLYTIHSLTRTFLQEQVAKWQPPRSS